MGDNDPIRGITLCRFYALYVTCRCNKKIDVMRLSNQRALMKNLSPFFRSPKSVHLKIYIFSQRPDMSNLVYEEQISEPLK